MTLRDASESFQNRWFSPHYEVEPFHHKEIEEDHSRQSLRYKLISIGLVLSKHTPLSSRIYLLNRKKE